MILFFVGFIIYALMRCLPTSFIENMARQKSMQPGSKSFDDWMAQLNAMYNMDKSIIPGYFSWLGTAIRGDFGDSWFYTVPVLEKFNDCIWLSFVMGGIAFILEILIAVPLGVVAATKQYSRADYTISVIALAGISLPTFFFAAICIQLFSVQLGWFPVNGLTSTLPSDATEWTRFWDKIWHLVIPVFIMVFLSVGSLMRYTRTNTLEVLNADYIRTARAKGLSEGKVIYKHAFRNTLIPLVTLLAGTLPGLFSGAMITEQMFAIPGIGLKAYEALKAGDIPFIMGYNMFLAILTVLGTLLADLMYAVVDPRVKILK